MELLFSLLGFEEPVLIALITSLSTNENLHLWKTPSLLVEPAKTITITQLDWEQFVLESK